MTEKNQNPQKTAPNNEKLFGEPLLIFYSLLFALGVMMIHAANQQISKLFALPELDHYLLNSFAPIAGFFSSPWVLTIGLGAICGLVLILLSSGLDNSSNDSRKSRNMLARTLGSLPAWQGFFIILISVVAEETFFRGGLQSLVGPSFSILLYGAVHIKLGEGGFFTLWNLRGFIIGFVLSYLYAASDTLLLGAVAHFIFSTITYIQLRKAFNREGLNAFLKPSESGERFEI